ncbi:MAG: Hpt domain-containing protein [Pseudomonadota bacterium]
MQAPAQRAAPAAELLDNSYLTSLENALGLELTRDVLADGLIEVSDRLDHLTEQSRMGDRVKVAQIAHDIAGSAGHMGLKALSVGARKLEQDLKAVPEMPMAGLVEAFLSLGPISLTALRVYLDHLC